MYAIQVTNPGFHLRQLPPQYSRTFGEYAGGCGYIRRDGVWQPHWGSSGIEGCDSQFPPLPAQILLLEHVTLKLRRVERQDRGLALLEGKGQSAHHGQLLLKSIEISFRFAAHR